MERALVSVALALACAGGFAAERLVCSFDDAGVWESENSSPRELSREHATEGETSLRVHFLDLPPYSTALTDSLRGDWSGFRYLLLDVHNAGKETFVLGMWLQDAEAFVKAHASWGLAPGDNTVFFDLTGARRKRVDLSRAGTLCLYNKNPGRREGTLYFDNMRLADGLPEKLTRPEEFERGNLLVNGSFESLREMDELGGEFDWWVSRHWEGPGLIGRGRRGAFKGESSLVLEGRGTCKVGVSSPIFRVPSPGKLKLAGYFAAVRLRNGRGGLAATLELTDESEGAPPGTDWLVKLPAGSYGWRRVEKVFDVPPGRKYCKLFVQLFGKGRVYVDELSLEPASYSTPAGRAHSAQTGTQLRDDGPVSTETPESALARHGLESEISRLKGLIVRARRKGLQALYAEVPLIASQWLFQTRWDDPRRRNKRVESARYLLARAREARRDLREAVAGEREERRVPPHPDYAKLEIKDAYFRLNEEPVLIVTTNNSGGGRGDRRFTAPGDLYAYICAAGATRYDFKRTPIWRVYRKHPETHRVYDGGWCGHIIRDRWSAGGGPEICVISLDHPLMREAIRESLVRKAKRLRERPDYERRRILAMGWEFSYVNYDEPTCKLFRSWLKEKHGDIEALNGAWKTQYVSFDDVDLPPHDRPEPNPAKHYDFGGFNLWRLTDYFRWVTGVLRPHIDRPCMTGGGAPFGADFWKTGIDEELLAEGVTDVFLSETGSRSWGTASLMDLQRSMDPRRLVYDPEYHATGAFMYLMFFHGAASVDYYDWNKHLRSAPVEHVVAMLRGTLDARRLAPHIIRFPRAPAELAILYSRGSLIQRFPGAAGHKTPYILELEKCYRAGTLLDCPLRFVTSRQLARGDEVEAKVLVVPGAAYENEDAVERVWAFAKSGGTVVVTPTSFVADEYARFRRYLDEIGVKIVREQVPQYLAGKARSGLEQPGTEYDFIQGPVAPTIVAKEPKRALKPDWWFLRDTEALQASGVAQAIELSGRPKIIARYEDGSPGVVRARLGRGKVYYLAAQLAEADMRLFLDRVLEEAGAERPIRVFEPGKKTAEGVEFRAVKTDEGYLAYAYNMTPEDKRVGMRTDLRFSRMLDLSRGVELPGRGFELSAYEGVVLKLELGD